MIEKQKVLKLSDGTEILPYQEAIAIAEKRESPDLLVRDLILLLLYARKTKPIYGRTMLMKQVFLLFEEILKKYNLKIQNPKFVPYHYGPYSFTVAKVAEDLAFAGYIKIEGKKNTRKERFIITQQGIREIEEKWRKLNENLKKEIENHRIAWDQMGIDGILKYVYTYYPEFKEKSKIKNKYKDIKWGRGKG